MFTVNYGVWIKIFASYDMLKFDDTFSCESVAYSYDKKAF
jgi:hypothetical protein